MQGRGINSIRWRFALTGAVLALAGMVARAALAGEPLATAAALGSMLLVSVLIGAATLWMASQLTANIESLRRSAEAVAAGDFDRPVDVDCACELGGLAASFRKMTSRLNANILRINTLAFTDPITRLPNRAVIEHLLGYALAPGRSEPFRAAIVFIDLDGFKRINDTLGHDGGDELLRQAAERLLQQGLGRDAQTMDRCTDAFGQPCERLPEDIVFARFAGDEFVAVLPGMADRAALEEVGRRLLGSLQEPFRVKGQEVSVSASIGFALTPTDTRSAQELLTFADLAMYSSKQAGKSRFRFFDHRIRERIVERMRTEAELRLALQRGELRLHFQPVVDLGNGELRAAEALVRWQHPERGLLAPGQFIEAAEQAGLMAALGDQVLVLALAQGRRWADAGLPCRVGVNVSPSQFNIAGFAEHVLRRLREAGVAPQDLTVEITESMAMTDFEATAQRLQTLREAGVRVAIDDFGVGFSNLSQLARLPVDVIKLDRSLIEAIGSGGKAEALLRAIVGMADALGLRTVAEGIETPAQRDFVASLACPCAQGYLFGRPMDAVAFDAWREAHAQESAQQSAQEAAALPA